MKKTSIGKLALYTVILLSTLSGCEKNDDTMKNKTPEYQIKTFWASLEEPTKTVYGTGGKVNWEEGDKILYYCKNNDNVSSYTIPETAHTVKITTVIPADADYLIAIYGAESLSNNEGKSVNLSNPISTEQTGLFGDAHVSVAKTYETGSDQLSFSNITSIVKFAIDRNDISYITFETQSQEYINSWDDMYVNFTGTVASPQLGDKKSFKTKVNVGKAGIFYFSTLPTTLTNGFVIRYYDSNDNFIGYTKYDESVAINANTILNLGTLDSRIVETRPSVNSNLSAAGTANSYLIPKQGHYSFDATKKGSSTEAIEGTATKVAVLWESFGNATTPAQGDVVKNVTYSGGVVSFDTGGKDGNALIAIKDVDGTILWSWHIWVCNDYYPDLLSQTIGSKKFMDRNLGATSCIPGEVESLGLLYQWGRKDPFIGIGTKGSSDQAASTPTPAWTSIERDQTKGTIAWATQHPTTFIKVSSWTSDIGQLDWLYEYSDTRRWNEDRELYDPCPPGWSVPEHDNLANNFKNVYVSTYGVYCNGTILFNFGPYIDGDKLNATSMTEGAYLYRDKGLLSIKGDGLIDCHCTGYADRGISLRCQKN